MKVAVIVSTARAVLAKSARGGADAAGLFEIL
jgi:hypothetical protein